MYNLTREELLYSLKEQLYFLDRTLSDFSKCNTVSGFENKVIGTPFEIKVHTEIEAKRLAAIIRILIHDARSKSLLTTLSIKEHIKYIDTHAPNDGRLHSMTGMRGVQRSNPNQYFGLVAKVNKEGSLIAVPLFKQHIPKWYSGYPRKDFNDWWNDEVINVNGHSLTRSTLTLNITNKDGGAHIDGVLPEGYDTIKRSNVSLNIKGVQTPFERNAVYASVAQIAWELLNSIDEAS